MAIEQPLAGKIALVTGGSRGIGAAIVRKLAAHGATVLVNYSHSATDAEALVAAARSDGGHATAIQSDVGDPARVRALFGEIDRAHGGALDILVNNAGVFRTGALADFTDADYDATFDINVRAVFEVTRQAVTRLRDDGRVINIGSIVGERVAGAGLSVYAASKFAVAGFTRGWARELAPRRITVNCVQPGPIDTDMNPADVAKNPSADFMRGLTAAGRYGTAAEVASLVAFLAGPEAAFITGTTQTVDGGVLA